LRRGINFQLDEQGKLNKVFSIKRQKTNAEIVCRHCQNILFKIWIIVDCIIPKVNIHLLRSHNIHDSKQISEERRMPEKMSSRERICAALNHETPDRIPIDLGGTRDSSIVVEGYDRLKKHFKVNGPTVLSDRMMRVVEVDEEILNKLEIDTRAIFPGAPYKSVATELGERSYRDSWGVERIWPEGSYYYDQTSAPLSGEITISDITRYNWPDPDDPGLIVGLKERLSWIRENTDAAAILTVPPPFIHLSQYLRGFEDWYIDFVMNSDVLEALFDAILEITLKIAANQIKEVGNDVDIVICGDDLGSQNGLQVSHDHYAKYIKPRHKKYIQQIHDLTPAKVLFHSCGSLASIIEDLIEIGVDVLNPVQVSARGMDPLELGKKYGKNLSFWGAMNSQSTLPFGSVNDVKKMVEDRIEQLGPDGGYVLSSCHNIQPDVPLDNVLAMFAHAKEYIPSWMR
jgi:uroporphyrinogen decarboxylase